MAQQMDNMADWFEACGRIRPDVETYTEHVRKWEKLRARDAREAQQNFATRHDRSFWKKRGKAPSAKQVKTALVATGVGAGAGLVLRIIMVFMMASNAATPTATPVDAGLVVEGAATAAATVVETPMQQLLSPATFIMMLLFAVAGAAVGLLPFLVTQKRFEKKMAIIEDEIVDTIRFLPPKYRNATCLTMFADWYTSYGMASFEKAIDECDARIRAMGPAYEPIQIMFDVPMPRRNRDGGFDEAVPNGEEVEIDPDAPDLSAPGMPEDIESHIAEGVEDAEEALNALIGMDAVKKQIRELRNRIEFYGGADVGRVGGENMIFLGSAGTGKTSVARIICRLLYDFGYIKANRLVEVDGDYLKSQYVGQTGERTSAIVSAAMGGILFIDEAYLLYDEKANSSVGKEAIGVLLKAMEDHPEDIVVILAGYEDPMARLVNSNEGFKSRIKHRVTFPDYNADELTEIFMSFVRGSKGAVVRVANGVEDAMCEYFEMIRHVPAFGNARAARNAYARLLDIHADRFIEGETAAEDKDRITEADVAAFVEAEEQRLAADGHNFAASSHLDESIISMAELKSRTKEGVVDPDAELNFLVGLDGAKQEMAQIKERMAFFASHPDAAGGGFNLNVALVGPAGCGKSTLASILCSVMYEAGCIRENRYLDITGDFLKASYVGQTGKRAEAAIEYSKGMMLFIDEAYLLDTAGEGGHDFGAEAIGVLVNAMEKDRDNIVVVLAGYEKEMDHMLDVNPGLRSRIGFTLHLEPYNVKQLCQVFQRVAYRRGFSCDKGCWPVLAAHLKQVMGNPAFGNARHVRQLVENSVYAHIARVGANSAQDLLLTADDVAGGIQRINGLST